MSEEVRPRLYLATARLGTQAGWMSFQVNQHDGARRLWLIALDVLRDTDHPLSTDQTVFVLFDMALQAVALGRPKEALSLVHLGHTAAQNNPATCDQALGQALDHFTRIDPGHNPRASFFDETMLAAKQGDVYYQLALASGDPHAASRAVLLLRQAMDGFSPDFARPRATKLTALAGAHALAGDTAVALATRPSTPSQRCTHPASTTNCAC